MQKHLLLLIVFFLSFQTHVVLAAEGSEKPTPLNNIKKVEMCAEDWNCFKCFRNDTRTNYKELKKIDRSAWVNIYRKEKIEFEPDKLRKYIKECKIYTYPQNNYTKGLEESCSLDGTSSEINFHFPKDLDANKHCALNDNRSGINDSSNTEQDDAINKSITESTPEQVYEEKLFKGLSFDELEKELGLDSTDGHLLSIIQFKTEIDNADISDKRALDEYKSKHQNFLTQFNQLVLFYDRLATACGGEANNKTDFGIIKIGDKNYGSKKVSRNFLTNCPNEFFTNYGLSLLSQHTKIFNNSSEYLELRDEGLLLIQRKYDSTIKAANIAANLQKEKDRKQEERRKAQEDAEKEEEKRQQEDAEKKKQEDRKKAEARKKAEEERKKREAEEKAKAEAAIKAEADAARLQSIEDSRKQKAAFWDTIWSIVTFTLFGIITVTAGFMLGSRKNKKTDSSNIEFNEKQRELNIKIKTLEEKNKSLERLIEKNLSKSEPKPSTKTNVPHEIVKELSEKEKQAEEDKSRQSSYWDAIDNPNLIEKFATTYNVIVLDKVGRVKKGENALLQVDQKSLEKSNFWAVPYKDVWVILPGRTLSINAAALTADDGRYGRELFAGIFKLEFGSQFEVTRQTLAKKTNDGFLVFQQGTVMLPK